MSIGPRAKASRGGRWERDEEATFIVGRGHRHLSGGGGIPCRAWAETEEAGEEGDGRAGVEGGGKAAVGRKQQAVEVGTGEGGEYRAADKGSGAMIKR